MQYKGPWQRWLQMIYFTSLFSLLERLNSLAFIFFQGKIGWPALLDAGSWNSDLPSFWLHTTLLLNLFSLCLPLSSTVCFVILLASGASAKAKWGGGIAVLAAWVCVFSLFVFPLLE